MSETASKAEGTSSDSLAPAEKSSEYDRLKTPTRAARLAAAAAAFGGFVFGSGLLAGSSATAEQRADGPATQARVVAVETVEPASPQRERRFYGTVRAGRRAALSFTIGGRLAARLPEVGERVGRGDVVARLDAAPWANAVAAHRATLAKLDVRLALQQRERRRDDELFAAGVIADTQRDHADAAYRSSRAVREVASVELREAQRKLSESILTAPFDGSVVRVHLEPGEFAAPGVPVLTVSADEGLEVELEVPESIAHRLSERAEVEVELPLAGLAGVSGHVRSLGSASAGTGLFPVVVELAGHEGVRAGMTAEVVLNVKVADALTVPVSAVLDPSGRRPIVVVVRGGKAHRVPVETGEMLDDRVVVRGDLRAGESVVVGGHSFLLDGDRVEVA